jgi:hypothetical protein
MARRRFAGSVVERESGGETSASPLDSLRLSAKGSPCHQKDRWSSILAGPFGSTRSSYCV